jgi:hypothetical protein
MVLVGCFVYDLHSAFAARLDRRRSVEKMVDDTSYLFSGYCWGEVGGGCIL